MRLLRNLFRLSWVDKGPGEWVDCDYCKGAGSVDLSTQLPIGAREQNANAVECRDCAGRGVRWEQQ